MIKRVIRVVLEYKPLNLSQSMEKLNNSNLIIYTGLYTIILVLR